MYVGKIIAWLFIAYMVYKPIGLVHLWIVSMTPPMSVIALVFCTIAYWTIAVAAWFARPVAIPYIYKKIRDWKANQLARKEYNLTQKALLAEQEKQKELDLLNAPLTMVKPVHTFLKVNEIAYAAVMAKLTQEKKGDSSGELVITDHRLIFSGEPKSFVLSLNSLISVTKYANGLRVSDGKVTYTLLFKDPAAVKSFGITLEKARRGQ